MKKLKKDQEAALISLVTGALAWPVLLWLKSRKGK